MSVRIIENLPQLQNLIKRDPESYRDEFESQFLYYSDAKEIFKLSPSSKDDKFYELVMFLAQVAQCYPENKELREFPNEVVHILRHDGPILHPDIRMGLVRALILLRNKDLLQPLLLLDVAFDLFRCQDKSLRKMLREHIVSDIKNINAKNKNMVLNRTLQDFLSRKLADNHAVAVKTALDVMIQLYRKGVWRDKKNVNIIATACYSKSAKIMVTAIKFFVGNDEGEQDESSDSDSDAEAPNVKRALLAMKVNKKTKNKRQNKVEKIKKAANTYKKKKNKNLPFDFSALHLINDPQSLAENIFKIFNKRNERFEVKLLMMNMVSRLIGVHQLYISNFYPTLQRYLFPHQREVTKIMAYAAQAAHPLVPPDDMQPVLRTLADNFVTERYSAEVMAMGLNAIRELCARNIFSMDEDLLQDLVEYRNHKDKGVYMAARSLMQLFRQRNPTLLTRKTRGVPTELTREEKPTAFGENTAKSFIPGAEILAFNTNPKDFPKNLDDDLRSDSEDSSFETCCDNDIAHLVNETLEPEEGDDDNESDSFVAADIDDEVREEDSQIENEDDEDQSEDKEGEGPQAENITTKDCQKSKIKKSKYKNKMEVSASDKVFSKKEAIREVLKLTPEERAAKASEIVSTRFLTDEDFAKIDAVRAVKEVERFKKKKGKKRPIEEVEEDKEIVPLSSIEMIYKKRRHDKASRLQAVLEGRLNREKFGSKKGRSNPFASSTNKEKSKSKSYNMVKHKKHFAKQTTTFREKKQRLKLSMMRQLKNK